MDAQSGPNLFEVKQGVLFARIFVIQAPIAATTLA